MSNVLIRDVPETVLAEIDRRVHDLGISRSEYLRRLLEQSVQTAITVTIDDFSRFGEITRDLANPEIMRQAWS